MVSRKNFQAIAIEDMPHTDDDVIVWINKRYSSAGKPVCDLMIAIYHVARSSRGLEVEYALEFAGEMLMTIGHALKEYRHIE